MLEKTTRLFLLSFCLLALSTSLEAASENAPTRAGQVNSSLQRKLEIMKDDQQEGTDIFAIPFDESDIEDQIQINQDERRNLNDLSLPKVNGSQSGTGAAPKYNSK